MNWIKKFEKEYKSGLEKKLDFIGEFKKRVMKIFKLKDEGNETEKSERWGYYQKTFGYLNDGFSGKTYRVDLDNGQIIEEKK